MIKPGEIQQKAREAGVRDQQIEKDYVLSWILKGIAQHEQLSKTIVFKGGTFSGNFKNNSLAFLIFLDCVLLLPPIIKRIISLPSDHNKSRADADLEGR